MLLSEVPGRPRMGRKPLSAEVVERVLVVVRLAHESAYDDRYAKPDKAAAGVKAAFGIPEGVEPVGGITVATAPRGAGRRLDRRAPGGHVRAVAGSVARRGGEVGAVVNARDRSGATRDGA